MGAHSLFRNGDAAAEDVEKGSSSDPPLVVDDAAGEALPWDDILEGEAGVDAPGRRPDVKPMLTPPFPRWCGRLLPQSEP